MGITALVLVVFFGTVGFFGIVNVLKGIGSFNEPGDKAFELIIKGLQQLLLLIVPFMYILIYGLENRVKAFEKQIKELKGQ